MWKVKPLITALALSLIGLPSSSWGFGGQDGGGGGVIRCESPSVAPAFGMKNVNGQRQYYKIPAPSILSHSREFEFLDLWEAETGYGPFFHHKAAMFWDEKLSKADWIDRAIRRLADVDPEMAGLVREYHSHVTARMFPSPRGSYVLGPDDTDIRFLPVGCGPPVGLGLYSDREDNLVYDGGMMSKLPLIDQAAFEVHEAVYKLLRDHDHATDSWQTRRIVGLMFSDTTFTKDQLQKDFQWP